MVRLLCRVGVSVWVACCVGCGPSVWERSFEDEPGKGPGTPTSSVVVRDAPWERVAQALAAEREAVASSEAHREDWSAEQARALELEVLQALQLPAPAEEATLIGRSHFTTTEAPDPEGPELQKFAREIGAEYVVWSSEWLGKAETIEHEPVERERWYWDRVWDADGRHYVYIRRWDTETDWVPVVIERDESRYVAFYVRRMQ
jgi:hypothetical protein